MIFIYETEKNKGKEKAILVGVVLNTAGSWEINDSLDELALLADTAGAEIVGRLIQARNSPDPAYFIGSGKLDELKNLCEETEADVIIIDAELTPIQIRNIEESTKIPVKDRSEIILNIFAIHARTKQAKLQVELAQYEYLRPRLVRMWSHFSKQRGGVGAKAPIGGKGAGEKQLEIDRRLVSDRITFLKKKLKELEKQHAIQTKNRKDYICAALVGYTNAGKSTLMNALSDANVYVEDQLFATLDSTTRSVKIGGKPILLTDTIGFIRKLPHDLVASFHATLEEVIDADYLLHIVDISHPQALEQIKTVNSVLEELNAINKPTIMVFNKIDKTKNGNFSYLCDGYDYSVKISAKNDIGIDKLIKLMENLQKEHFYERVTFTIPNDKSKLISEIYSTSEVIYHEYEGNSSVITADMRKSIANKFKKLLNHSSANHAN